MVGAVPDRPSAPTSRRNTGSLLWLVTMAVITTAVLVVGGFGTGQEDLTPEQMVAKVAGPELSQAEIEERLALADLLCGLEARVLNALWTRLDAQELEFQDWVFGHRCPDRLSTYAPVRPETGNAVRLDDDPDAEVDDEVDDEVVGGGGDAEADTTTSTARASRITSTTTTAAASSDSDTDTEPDSGPTTTNRTSTTR